MVDTLKNKLNSYDENVQFTVEIEDERTHTINFLDLTVGKHGNRLRTKWYHKTIASNRILNYYSKHPKNMIRNVAKSFIKRVFTVSHKSFHQENIEEVKRILKKNSFPEAFIEKLMKQVCD